MIGDELGSATDADRLLISSGLSNTNFCLDRQHDFWSCHTDFTPKSSPKNGNFVILSFLGHLGEIELDSQTVWTYVPAYALLCHGQCFLCSSPKLLWLTSFDIRKLYPLLADPARKFYTSFSFSSQTLHIFEKIYI